MKWPYWQRTEGSKGSMLAKDSDSWGWRKMQAGCLLWTGEREGGREARGRGNCGWKYSGQRYWNSEAKIYAHKYLGLQQVISGMINIFTVHGDFDPWRCLSPWLSAVQATRWPGVSWAKPANSEERIVETISDIPEAGFGGRAGVGVVFHRLWLRRVSANHKHKYRRDCLDSPMCVLNIKNLQGVNKCFMWNWKTERRKDEVPDPRKQALRWGSKANHRLTEWDVINTKDWVAPITEDRLSGQNCYGNQPHRKAMWCEVGSPLEKMSL